MERSWVADARSVVTDLGTDSISAEDSTHAGTAVPAKGSADAGASASACSTTKQ